MIEKKGELTSVTNTIVFLLSLTGDKLTRKLCKIRHLFNKTIFSRNTTTCFFWQNFVSQRNIYIPNDATHILKDETVKVIKANLQ